MALSAAESSGGPGAGPRDLESLDAYIQNTLSAFYLPFEATAATVLWQLFSVAETLHSGDGLRCLTHFLIPAKKALQRLQQEACARYAGLVFLHPGWPLCIHEKVVVQLASLHEARLRPGDFYLQVTSAERQSARLVLKCLSPLGNTEEVTVPEAMYGCVFTGEFLQQVNAGRGCVPLQNCLLTSGSAVHRTPWSSVTDPVFLPAGAIPQTCPSHVGPEKSLLGSTSEVPGPARAMASSTTLPHHHGHLGCEQPGHPPYLRRADLDGPRKTADRGVMKGRQESPESNRGLDPTDQDSPHPTCPGDLSSPQARRKLVGDRARAEARRWFRKSYMEALRNPMPLGPSSEESLTGNKDLKAGMMTSPTQRESPDPTGSPQQTLSKEKTVALRWTCSGASGRTRPRRSQSWDRSLRSSQRTEPAAHRTSHHAVSRGSGGLSGGHAVGTRNACSVSPSHVAAAAPTCTQEEAVLPTPAFVREREPSRCPDVTAELLCSEGEGRPPSTVDLPSQGPQQVLDTSQELLQSGVITLPGTRDRHGRAVVQVCTRGPLWSSKHSSHAELSCLLMYLCGIPRKEVRDLGLLVLVDARRSPVSPALSWALSGLQNTSPPVIHSVLLLVDKESAFSPDRGTTIQCEVVSSLKALHKLVDSSQLTADLDGSFPYSHRDWICFRMKLEAFTADCKEAIVFLQNSLRSLDTHRVQRTSQEVTEAITRHEKMMKLVLEDALLVWLRLEGSVVLARLRREGLGAGQDCQDAVEAASRLYNQVDEEVHRLVLASNRGLQRLENLRELRTLEEGHDQVERWFEEELGKFLGPREPLSCEDVGQRQQELRALLASVTRYCQKGLQLVKESSQNSQETTQGFQRRLSAMVGRAECLQGELACWTHLSTLYETVDRWLLRCTKYPEHVVPELRPSSPIAEYLKSCHQEATKVTAEAFPRASGTVLGLGGQQALQRWRDLWLRYQQTQLRLEEALAGASLGPGMLTVDQSPPELKLAQEATWKHREPPTGSPAKVDGRAGEWARGPCSLTGQAILCGWEGQGLCGPWAVPPSLGVAVGPGASMTDTDSSSTCSSYSTSTPAGRPRKHPLKKMMKIPGFEMPQLDSGPRDACQLGHTGVFIRGLEVTGTVPRLPAGCPPVPRSRSLSSPSRTQPPEEVGAQHTGSRLQHIVAEMISTEQEYVRSLGYVIDNYFPEMDRMDLPQGLRGKRSVIFGNVEKLRDFHQQCFLQELERCRHCPLAVGRGFLRHEEEFHMYALYSKNKPQSDALLSSHGNAFFKDKQQELGDKMDLASYLLKPVQRMGKYVLLLQDLVKEASRCPGREQELGELQAAGEVVRFQLRHGNDLLAMDAVRGCDVDLKEQGQLRCQDEFLVCCGRRKYLRRVFLFEDLILFSKTKKVDRGHDLYLYKQSFKASSVEVKRAWTEVIGKILWRQALRNRELRMREVASMGMGSKPFLDIQPSEAAISDRAIDHIMKGTGEGLCVRVGGRVRAMGPLCRSQTSQVPSSTGPCRSLPAPQTQASIAVSSVDHATRVKRPHSTISESSSSSGSQASSFLGPPNLRCPPALPSGPGRLTPEPASRKTS
nr:pleckstrin homology domain-containing family G member 4B isoform X3 [Oryctolagus cuniculus]